MEQKLFEALKNNDAKLVKELIKSGANLGVKNGQTILDFPKIMADLEIKNVIINAVFDRIQNTKYQDKEIEAIEFKVIKSIANNDLKLKNDVKLRKTIDLFNQSPAERIRNKLLQSTDRENNKINNMIHHTSDMPLNLANVLDPKQFQVLFNITKDLAAAVLNKENKTFLPKKQKRVRTFTIK